MFSPRLLKEYLLHVERSDLEYIPPLPKNPDEDEFVDPLEEFYEWAMKPFLPLFREISPLDQDRLYTLQLAGDELIPVPLDITAGGRPLDKSMFPVYRPNDIHIRPSNNAITLPTQPGKVYIKGRHVCFFKQILPGDVAMTAKELSTYANIHSAELREDVRVSRLLGVVEDERTSRIVGLLLSYIECENKTLLCPGWGYKRASLREKWLKQITYSLHELHARQIT
ncbi:hypothetical protein K469DRAFT_742801 [Zopfia rhizophila CBS 207.26]|uniref:Uncharacterized protein n=1 Tax=Zopfia rhizophila CBS 207.26 TaxID=1314779 RepID=A0A6A6DEG6_9PEZI|nr:hypothetical protein K469DRAFT_742801 [Zopfia rhizophila CBS 207.26]